MIFSTADEHCRKEMTQEKGGVVLFLMKNLMWFSKMLFHSPLAEGSMRAVAVPVSAQWQAAADVTGDFSSLILALIIKM